MAGSRISRLAAPLAPWALPVLLVAAWQIASRAGWLSSRILPEPWAVAKAFWLLTVSGELWTHLRVSLCRDVILPGALPSILVGVRFALGLVWVLLIVAETISAQAGIGYMTMNAREFLQTDVVLVGVLLYALLGKAADWSARGLERRFLRWNPAYR